MVELALGRPLVSFTSSSKVTPKYAARASTTGLLTVFPAIKFPTTVRELPIFSPILDMVSSLELTMSLISISVATSGYCRMVSLYTYSTLPPRFGYPY